MTRGELYGNWLVSLGFDLVCAADAVVAMTIARTCQPNPIITELQLRRSEATGWY